MHLGAAAPMRWWAPTATGIALVLAGLAQAGALAWPGHGAPLWWLHILSLAGFIALLQRSPSASSALVPHQHQARMQGHLVLDPIVQRLQPAHLVGKFFRARFLAVDEVAVDQANLAVRACLWSWQ